VNRVPLALIVIVLPAWTQVPITGSLRGTVTDPSGAAVPGVVVHLRAAGNEKRAKTDYTGQYSFPALKVGTYQVRMTAKGFAVLQQNDFVIERPTVLDARMSIQSGREVISVGDELGRVGTEPESNGSLVMRERQLKALSDDPDELALQLQALAGPAPGPNGGQTYIDGFTGGNLPPKASIREVRINSNPFSPEYDRPGFARIEIFTKPGSTSVHGQSFVQYNSGLFNSRNPLVAQSTRSPYASQFYGLNLSGPLRRDKASFTLDVEHRNIDDNAFILATTLDRGLKPMTINQVVAAPQLRTTFSPRLDYALNPKNTLVARYQDVRIDLDNQGAGDFNLVSRAYDERQTERTLQITGTSIVSPRAMDETRLQYSRSITRNRGHDGSPAVDVQGAFNGGGATVGNSSVATNNWELANVLIMTRGRHTFKWGGRVRHSALADTSLKNFAGTFTFYSLDEYRRTLALEPGSGPSQFSLNSGTAATRVTQTDAGLFANDDWRARSNLTVSFGMRYELQTHLGDRSDWAPRVGIAWSLGSQSSGPAKTVLRAGFGFFYDRLPISATLNALRYDGTTQQSYLILNPTFYPDIPSPAVLQAAGQPQQLQTVYSGIKAPRMYQASIGLDRQITSNARLTATWISSRGVHLLNARNINAPLGEMYPFGDASVRLLTESAGFSRQNQIVLSPSLNYRKVSLKGYYALSSGKDDNEGLPADPYNVRAEWGPSSYGDVRHRMVISTAIPLLWKFSVMPFLLVNSGPPYNIRTGLDPGHTGFPFQRPAINAGATVSECIGGTQVYAARYGCFNTNPDPGKATIGRNYGRGPAAVNLALRLGRTWTFGRVSEAGDSRRYSLALSGSTMNAFNHPNFGPPEGNLSSPYFGQPRNLGGLIVMSHGGAASAYNRKIDVQVRFTF
jgi:hypothetical protein